jgi:hypothetical protein
MARRIFDLANFFADDADPLGKNLQLASRISIACDEAGLDVKANVVGEKVRVIITADEIKENHLRTLGTIIEDEFQKIPHEYITRH